MAGLVVIFMVSAFCFCSCADASVCSRGKVSVSEKCQRATTGALRIPGLSHTTVMGTLLHGTKEVWNTNGEEDLQILAIIYRPRMTVFIYDDWYMPRTAAKLKFPIFWDGEGYQTAPNKI